MKSPTPPALLPGDVLLCHADSIVSKLIRVGETVRYHGWLKGLKSLVGLWEAPEADPCWVNHVAVYVGNGKFIEALANGLTMTTWANHQPGTYRVARLADVVPTVTDTDRAKLVAFALASFSRHDDYDYLSIASIILQIITPAKLDLSYDGALICSAFAAQCWEHIGYIIPTRSSLTTMPADIATWVGR